MKTILLTAILALGLIGHNAQAQEATVGQPAPAFSVTDTKGATQSLAAHAGKIVILEWTNPECPYVKKHYSSGNMQALQKAAVDDGAVWLRVNSGAVGKQGHQTAEQFDATSPNATANIIDESGELGRKYGAKTTPHLYVIDTAGTLVYAGAIDDNDSSDADDIATSKNYVTAALADLKAGKPVEVATSKPYGCAVKYAD